MLSFLVPFVLGILAALVGLFFLLFRLDVTPALESALAARRAANRAEQALAATPAELRRAAILRTHDGAPAESAVWLNSIADYLFGAIATKLNQSASDGRLERYINEEILSEVEYPLFVRPVVVSELFLGSSLPTLQSIAILQSEPDEPLVFEATISYEGSAEVKLSTGVGIEAPFVNRAVLPIEFAMKAIKLAMRARIQLDVATLPTLGIAVSLLPTDPPPTIDFELSSSVGAALKLTDLRVVQQIFQKVLRELIEEELLLPHRLETTVDLW